MPRRSFSSVEITPLPQFLYRIIHQNEAESFTSWLALVNVFTQHTDGNHNDSQKKLSSTRFDPYSLDCLTPSAPTRRIQFPLHVITMFGQVYSQKAEN